MNKYKLKETIEKAGKFFNEHQDEILFGMELQFEEIQQTIIEHFYKLPPDKRKKLLEKLNKDNP